LFLSNSGGVIENPDVRKKGKKFDMLDDLVSFQNKYGKRTETDFNADFC
jgi:hypothetical protein